MTIQQDEIELLEQRGNDAELLSLLAFHPEARARHRAVAHRFRLRAIELSKREEAAARRVSASQLDPRSGDLAAGMMPRDCNDVTLARE
ncbi:hypothetical protein [Bradyrhizobium aeschynomenes]|uniref:hypothetical protein n=1 Tax=Bradyrhizobium aeschynomenes TaxID=2734909 RepID=UPI0015581746|nr:hypothetical protein [Bradyrhizobium aeschynomenes]NPV22044.1 hypothetical protein [Bradyrhizobium aeschynomenes]